ncbi:hypothetical protein MAIC_50350 [Mycolicibacterium aichiense]|uniref:Uncharacterized protein n=1 Tax=Mycolicibacterium aichiense TaxID=1799 RepID=A0AAD1MD69_9MYCO|nr:hypothetical protein MAIC_50350 [Mycolicibacterium aichiense]
MHGANAEPRQPTLTARGSDDGHEGYVAAKFGTFYETGADEAPGPDDGDGFHCG